MAVAEEALISRQGLSVYRLILGKGRFGSHALGPVFSVSWQIWEDISDSRCEHHGSPSPFLASFVLCHKGSIGLAYFRYGGLLKSRVAVFLDVLSCEVSNFLWMDMISSDDTVSGLDTFVSESTVREDNARTMDSCKSKGNTETSWSSTNNESVVYLRHDDCR